MKKRILSLVLALCLALSLAPAAFAANIVDSGTCGADADGNNIAWTLDADGNLTVTGAGLLQKKAFQNRKDIVTVKFVCTDDRDVMSINILDYAFAGCTNLRSIDFGSRDARDLHAHAFEGCTGLQRVTVQNNVTSIGTGVFSGCTALTDVYYTGAQAQWDQIRTPKGEDVLGSAELHCNAAAHTFAGDWVETTPATCTDDGVLTRICTDPGCGRTQTRIVPSLGHDWDDGVTRIEPDGLLAGVVVYTCGRCALTAIELTAPEIWAYQHFTDLDPESWSYEGIQYCVATGLMSGVGGTTFLPGGVTTRAQLVQILYNLEGEPAVTGSTPFTDLTADWYQDAVTWAYQNHIVSGTSATTFAPDLVVTREQIAVVLVDFLMNVYGLERTWIPAALDVYPDGPDVSDWAQAGMSDALSLKLISGATNGESLVRHLNPRAGATRAEVATILENMCSGVLGIG